MFKDIVKGLSLSFSFSGILVHGLMNGLFVEVVDRGYLFGFLVLRHEGVS